METEELSSISKELGNINEKQEQRVRFYESRAHHLTIAYLVFQGAVLLSVSLLSESDQCKRWWVPFTISLLVAVIFFMAFLDAVVTFYYTQYHLDLNYLEQQIINKQMYESRTAHCSIKIGEASHSTEKRPYHEIIKPDVVQLFKRKVYIVITILVLLAFTAIMLFSCHSFLCNDSSGSLVTTFKANSQSSSSSP